jgi:hypothetical protein
MTVNRTALWIVMALCSMAGVAAMVPARVRQAPSEGRLRRIGIVCGAVLDGVGIGLTAALLVLVTAAAVVRVEDLLR